MALPDVTVTVSDGALGLAGANPDNLHAKLGVSSLGTANTVYAFSDITTLRTTLGSGPLVEALASHLAFPGGPVLAVPVAASNVGTVGTVTRVGTSPSPGLATTGTPRDKYDVVARVIAGGAVATATFDISFDGGVTYLPVRATAATVSAYAADTGLTLTFAAGTYVAGDTYTFSTVAPTYSSSDLNTALDAVKNDSRSTSFVHVVGTVGGATDADKITNFAALVVAVETKMESAETGKRWGFAILEKPDTAEGAFEASATWLAVSAPRVSPAGGRETIISQVSNRQVQVSLATGYAARLAATPVQEHPGKFIRGPLKGVLAMSRDERATPGLDSARITSARTFPDVVGFYISNGKMAAATGSDFAEVQNRRVVDKLCRVGYLALLRFLNDEVRVNKVTGFILEKDAKVIEAYVLGILNEALVTSGNASSVQATVNRTTNILSSETLYVSLRVIPKGYAKFIQADVGLVNPALVEA